VHHWPSPSVRETGAQRIEALQPSLSIEDPVRRIAAGAGEVLILCLLVLISPAAIGIDLFFLENTLQDSSVTESMQEGLLLASALVFWFHASRNPEERGFLVLVAGFLTCMLIREFDFLFDRIGPGFWQWPAVMTAALSIGYASRTGRGTIVEPMARFMESRTYVHLAIGLVIVIVFSRVFGSGNLLWENIIVEYQHLYKSVIQEGLELLGYVFVAWGSFLTLRRGTGARGSAGN